MVRKLDNMLFQSKLDVCLLKCGNTPSFIEWVLEKLKETRSLVNVTNRKQTVKEIDLRSSHHEHIIYYIDKLSACRYKSSSTQSFYCNIVDSKLYP